MKKKCDSNKSIFIISKIVDKYFNNIYCNNIILKPYVYVYVNVHRYKYIINNYRYFTSHSPNIYTD